jgi:hypothetical protein
MFCGETSVAEQHDDEGRGAHDICSLLKRGKKNAVIL